MNIFDHYVWAQVLYPGGRRKSRVALACCSTWPRTHRSWWAWRLLSLRPASPHRRPSCASCSVCRRRNKIRRGTLISQTNDWCLCTLICLCQLIKQNTVPCRTASQPLGFCPSLVLLNGIHRWLVIPQSSKVDHPTIHSEYFTITWPPGRHSLPSWVRNTQLVIRNVFCRRSCASETPSDCALSHLGNSIRKDGLGWLKTVSHSWPQINNSGL